LGVAILIGDSTAQALSEAFTAAMEKRKITSYILTKPGCQFILRDSIDLQQATLLGVNQTQTRGDSVSNTCFQHNDAIRRWVNLRPNAHIYISNRSSSFVSTLNLNSLYRKTLLENAQSLKTPTNKVTLIGPNPDFPDEQKYFSGNLTIWQEPYLPYEKLERSKMRIEPFQDNAFFQFNAPLIGLKYIDLIGVFCTSVECDRKDGMNWLYGAKNHLSVYGAQKIEPLFIASVSQ